ncbi:cell surface A33 antigen [Platysternon megacephalum]|uniref:Cell surface A33 antigen n=1 Tax=Platysternon megacephalum TaxID=55544 RepID=A0A4D9EBB3_9SAUR|nr:cell surface A33 antigen [Platysternon megacephalum]
MDIWATFLKEPACLSCLYLATGQEETIPECCVVARMFAQSLPDRKAFDLKGLGQILLFLNVSTIHPSAEPVQPAPPISICDIAWNITATNKKELEPQQQPLREVGDPGSYLLPVPARCGAVKDTHAQCYGSEVCSQGASASA